MKQNIKGKVLKDNVCKLHPITSGRAIDLTIAEVSKVIDEVKPTKFGRWTVEDFKEELKQKLGIK